MGEYTIAAGSTEGYRYIGVKPPVSGEVRSQIFEALGEDIEHMAIGNGLALSTVGNGSQAYSEMLLDTWLLESEGISTGKIAGKIAEVIRANGDIAMVDPDCKPLGPDTSLF
jgi:hypothetical protein